MKINLVLAMLLLFSRIGIAQFTAKSIPVKSASFYHPFFDNKLVLGQWIGDIYSPAGLEVNLTTGSGTFILSDPKTNEILFKFKGNTFNGIWDGYIYYMEKSKRGTLFAEGFFKNGQPHGKLICKLLDGSYLAGNFQYGKSFDKISLSKNKEELSTYCNGFDFMQFLKNDSVQIQKCKREIVADDPLYGAAIIISNLAGIIDKHTSIDKFLECVRLNNVEIFVRNPDFDVLGSEAILSVVKNPMWKDQSLEEIQEQLKQNLIDNHHENLSRSIEFISFLSCVLEESRNW